VVEYQVVDLFSITSDILSISLSNDNQAPLTVDLSPYLDNTDDQGVDNFSLSGTTLTLEIETDGQGPHTVDLAALQDGTGTDDQTLSYTLGGTLSIEDGNSVDLSDLLDNTDDQGVDNFSLSGTTLTLEIENDGQTPHTVDLSSLTGVGTDDQTVDTLSLSGTILTIALEDDNEAPYTLDLASLQDGTGTDDQTLSLVGNSLSIESGNSVDLSPYLDNTDDQQVDNFSLSGTTLTLEIEADGQAPHTVDLSGLTGTGTDDQTVDTLSLSGTVLTLALEGDNEAPYTLDLVSLQDGTGTDDQGVDNFSLSGTTLTLEIETDGQAPHTVDLASLQDGTGTDDQTVDTLSLSGTILTIALEGDNEAPYTLDLASLQDGTGTDDQRVDNFSLSGTTLTLEIEADGQAPHTVSLAALQDGTGTDDQTLSLVSNTLSIESGNSVDLSPYLDNTDDQQVDNFSISSNILRLEIESDGQAAHTVNLNPYLDNTDNQALSYGGAGSLSISGGNSVDLSDLLDNTDSQNLTLAGNNLSLTNGGTVDLSPYLDNTDNQTVDTFSLTGTLLTLALERDNESPYTVDIASVVGDDDWRFTGTEDYESHAYRNGRTSIATTAATHGLRVDSTFQFRVDGGTNIFDWQDGTGVSDIPGLVWRAEGGAEGGGAFINGENNLILATLQEPVLNRQVLGSLVFSGQDPNSTGNVTPGAFIKAYADGNWTTSSNTTEMEFYITLDGETNSTSMLRLLKNDRVDLPTYFDKDDGLPTSIIGRSALGHLTRHPITGTPTEGQVLKAQSGALVWADDNDGAGQVNVDLNLLRDTLTQTGHGYTQSQTPLPFFVDQSTGDLLPAVNDFDSTTHVGFIIEVLNTNELVVAAGGVHFKAGHGYAVGKEYFTTGTAHTYATQAPASEINDWVWSVLDADRLLLHNVRPYNPSADNENPGGLWFWDGAVAEFLPASDTLGLSGNDGIELEVLNDSLAITLDFTNLTATAPGSSDFLVWQDQSTGVMSKATVSQVTGGPQTLSIDQSTAVLTISAGNSVDLSEAVDEQINTLLTAGTNVTLNYNDGANTLTISSPDDQALSLVGNSLSLTDGGSVDLSGYLDNTDSQTLTLSSNTLSLTNGGSVDLSGYLDNTDSQTLTPNAGTTSLTISGGNSVSLAELVDDRVDALLVAGTDIGLSYNDAGNTLTVNYTGSSGGDPDQTLSFSSPNLTISGTGGNTVDLSALQDGTGTDDQTLTLSGNTLSIESGNSVSLAAYLDNTDNQDISLSTSLFLSITGGSGEDISEDIEDHLGLDFWQDGTNTNVVYNDGANTISIEVTDAPAHASSHITGGSDQVDGDRLDIDWNPSHYTPATTPSEVTSNDNLTAHLYGIDQELEAVVPDNNSSQSSGSIDWGNDYQGYQPINMTGLSSITISFSNSVPGGAYIIRFTGADDGDTVNWPSSVKYENGTAVGTDILSSGRRMVQLLYDGTDYFVPGGY
jgi:hypothetical protein